MAMRIDGFQRVRAKLDISEKTGAITDDLWGGPGRFGRGARLRFEFLFVHDDELADPSLISAARLRVLSTSDPDSALAMDKTIGPESMHPSISQADWDTGEPDKCHMSFEFTAAQCAEGAFTGTLADTDTPHWFLLTYGVGADILFAGTVLSFDAATGAAGTPPVGGSAATLDEIRALFDATLSNYVKFVGNPAGATVELSNTVGQKVKFGADDNGDPLIATQTTT